MNSPDLLTVEDALRIMLERAPTLEYERVHLAYACGRVLAEHIHADRSLPPFNRVSVDGYAARLADVEQDLFVLETVAAGETAQQAVEPGTCIKIMTGAPLPHGADCVFMIEHVTEIGDGVIRYAGPPPRKHYSPEAEDAARGDILLSPGFVMRPQHLAICAAVGATAPLVSRMPRVAVLSTGDELVTAHEFPGPSEIRNSNSFQLATLAASAGAYAQDAGIVSDKYDDIRDIIEALLVDHDVILTSGGVSMGDFDLVPKVLQDIGLTPHVRRVRVQPGKPILFATGERRAVFGLAGNPVSSFVQFHLFVRRFLLAMQGMDEPARRMRLPLLTPISRQDAARALVLPGQIHPGGVALLPFHGSGHLTSLAAADCLAIVPAEVASLVEKDLVDIILLSTL